VRNVKEGKQGTGYVRSCSLSSIVAVGAPPFRPSSSCCIPVDVVPYPGVLLHVHYAPPCSHLIKKGTSVLDGTQQAHHVEKATGDDGGGRRCGGVSKYVNEKLVK
jgi:hypothetical protein